MKLFFNILLLILVGLLVCLVVYPFLHEIGHCIFAYVLSCDVKNINFTNDISVDCVVNAQNKWLIVFVALGGLIFPFIIAVLFRMKSFWLWCASVLLKLVCLLSFVISIVSAVLTLSGSVNIHDDSTVVINYAPQLIIPYLLAVFMMFIICLFLVIKTDFINKILVRFWTDTFS